MTSEPGATHCGTAPCPPWCSVPTDHVHDVDDTYGVYGTHHDSRPIVVDLGTAAGDDGRVYVRASQLVPSDGEPWPVLVEIDAELADSRRADGTGSIWLLADEATKLADALSTAARLAGSERAARERATA